MQTSEQGEQRIADLIEVTGRPRKEAEERLRDDDLWLIEPERRFAFDLEEDAVDQWEGVVQFLDSMGDTIYGMCAAYTQMLWDAQIRARVALKRVRVRAEETASNADAG